MSLIDDLKKSISEMDTDELLALMKRYKASVVVQSNPEPKPKKKLSLNLTPDQAKELLKLLEQT